MHSGGRCRLGAPLRPNCLFPPPAAAAAPRPAPPPTRSPGWPAGSRSSSARGPHPAAGPRRTARGRIPVARPPSTTQCPPPAPAPGTSPRPWLKASGRRAEHAEADQHRTYHGEHEAPAPPRRRRRWRRPSPATWWWPPAEWQGAALVSTIRMPPVMLPRLVRMEMESPPRIRITRFRGELVVPVRGRSTRTSCTGSSSRPISNWRFLRTGSSAQQIEHTRLPPPAAQVAVPP